MTAVTFGEFASQVDERLAAVLACDLGQADPAAAAGELRRVVGRMARFLEDRAPAYAIESLSTVDMLAWQRAAVDARTAVRWAVSCLPEDLVTVSIGQPGPGKMVAGCLGEVATAMMAGRDLLQTHQMTGPDGSQVGRSAWAAAVISLPVTRALTGQVARWCGQVALVTARLAATSSPGPPAPPGVVGGLQGAAQWLWLAQAAVRPAQAADPVTADDQRLLTAIPLPRSQRRVRPDGREPAQALCAGITISAERLRTAVLATTERQRSAPVTADAWRRTAAAAAVTGQAGEHLLRSLASQPCFLPIHPQQLQQAATVVRQATLAWRQAAARWRGLATQTRGYNSPVVTEIGDLMLRMGRLAWEDPHWTPTRPHTTKPTTASSATGARAILAVVHQAADAFAQVAAADDMAVTATGRAGRLYVPTRTLPDGYDVPRRYATAPAERTWPLLAAYTAAVRASAQAAAVLADLALAVDAPSSTLALARAACPNPPLPAPSHDQPTPAAPVAAADALPHKAATPGPVEQAIQQLQLDDPAMLLRAAAIDQAARQLLTQAGQASAQPGPHAADTAAEQRPSDAAQLAARDCPTGLAIKPANGKPGNRTTTRPPAGPSPRPPQRPSARSRPPSRHTR